jgi:hypothetical protein
MDGDQPGVAGRVARMLSRGDTVAWGVAKALGGRSGRGSLGMALRSFSFSVKVELRVP